MSNNIYQLVLRVKQLLCLAEAVRCGSISHAAKENSIKQPNLSAQISNLEKTLQKKLIDRYSKGVGLTEDGEPYYQIATEVKNLLIASDNISAIDNKTGGNIRLWTSDGLASVYLAGCLEKFALKYPKVNLDINCSIDMPELHEFDMALLFHKPTTKSLTVVAERNLNFSLYASKEYISRHGIPQSIKDMCQNHKICANLVYTATWPKWQSIEKKAPYVTTINNGSSLLLNLVKESFGIALMPIEVALKEQDLVEIKNIIPHFKTKFYLVVKNTCTQNQKIKELAKIISAETLKQPT